MLSLQKDRLLTVYRFIDREGGGRVRISGREYADYEEYVDEKLEYKLDEMKEGREEGETYFICQRCGIQVKYDAKVLEPPEELLCEDCYLEGEVKENE